MFTFNLFFPIFFVPQVISVSQYFPSILSRLSTLDILVLGEATLEVEVQVWSMIYGGC